MTRYQRFALAVVFSMSLYPDLAWAQARWAARVSFGSTRIHSWDPRAAWGEVRLSRAFGDGLTSIDFGLATGASRAGFSSLTTGFEVRPWPRARIAPFVRSEIGFLGESDFGGVVGGVGGGVIAPVGPRFAVRVGAAFNMHGRTAGPVTAYGGFEFRW